MQVPVKLVSIAVMPRLPNGKIAILTHAVLSCAVFGCNLSLNAQVPVKLVSIQVMPCLPLNGRIDA
jgi:hypothetical protein